LNYVRTDGLGLVIHPSNLGCVGKGLCKYLETENGCFSSGHHLYFEEDKFKNHSTLAWEFREDPNNKLVMARCQEDRIHDRFDGARVPTAFIMDLFLQESAIFQDLGILSNRVLSKDRNLEKQVKLAEKIEYEEKIRGRFSLTEEYWDKVSRTAETNEHYRRVQQKKIAAFSGFSAISLSLLRAHRQNSHLIKLLEEAA
jgi:hypothetical protein